VQTADVLRRAEARAEQNSTRAEVERPFANDDQPASETFRVPPPEPLPRKPGS